MRGPIVRGSASDRGAGRVRAQLVQPATPGYPNVNNFGYYGAGVGVNGEPANFLDQVPQYGIGNGRITSSSLAPSRRIDRPESPPSRRR